MFNHDSLTVLNQIADGWQADTQSPRYTLWHLTRAPRLQLPNLNIITQLARAQYHCTALNLTYLSHNGESKRAFLPHSFFDDGIRWYIRGYDRRRNTFLSLHLNRISAATPLESKAAEHERINADKEWNNTCQLTLIPHPKLDNPALATQENGLINGKRTETVPQALIGYWLRSWRVDASTDHHLDPHEYPLALENPQQYEIFNGFTIAPGVVAKETT